MDMDENESEQTRREVEVAHLWSLRLRSLRGTWRAVQETG